MSVDLAAKIRDVPDFPKPGIVFKDIMPLLADAEALRDVSSPNSSSSRASRTSICARSQSSSRSSSASSASSALRRLRSRPAGDDSSWRITRSGRNSSRCRRRMVSSRSTSSSLNSR